MTKNRNQFGKNNLILLMQWCAWSINTAVRKTFARIGQYMYALASGTVGVFPAASPTAPILVSISPPADNPCPPRGGLLLTEAWGYCPDGAWYLQSTMWLPSTSPLWCSPVPRGEMRRHLVTTICVANAVSCHNTSIPSLVLWAVRVGWLLC